MTRHDPGRADRILLFIEDATAREGFPPTVREIMRAVGLKSPAAAAYHLSVLERDGLITRRRGLSRSLRVAHDTTCPTCGRAA